MNVNRSRVQLGRQPSWRDRVRAAYPLPPGRRWPVLILLAAYLLVMAFIVRDLLVDAALLLAGAL